MAKRFPPSRNEVVEETRTTARTHHLVNGDKVKFHSVIEERNEYPAKASPALHQEMIEPTQPAPPHGAIDDYEPGGNHYEMGDNGNYNSGAAAVARYPRMAHEIGGADPEGTGFDRIQLEHDDPLLHRR